MGTASHENHPMQGAAPKIDRQVGANNSNFTMVYTRWYPPSYVCWFKIPHEL